MNKLKETVDGINIFEHDYDRWRNYEKCSGLVTEGVYFRFYRWLLSRGLIDEYESVIDIYNGNNPARDGNRYDLNDNYLFTFEDGYEKITINFLYVVNGNLWAVLYDEANNEWYGDFEIPVNV